MVIAPGRARRPGAFLEAEGAPTPEELDECPFCEGREDRTPPETLALPHREPANSPGWRVRAVPNLFPAFDLQEVVIHSAGHVRSIGELPDDELDLVAEAWSSRSSQAGSAYVHAFVNEGRAAGGSLPHSHSQLVGLPARPQAPADDGSPSENPSVTGNETAALVCPYASRTPYEMRVTPLEPDRADLGSRSLPGALRLAAEGVRRLHALEGRVPLNLWLQPTSSWHLAIVPRLTQPAGLELGAGIYVNPLPPEEAAARLRAAG